jgi:hypothetical protein
MEFRIADTFVDSLAKLPNQEQKAVKTNVFDLQVNPASPGMSFHKLDRAQDVHFTLGREAGKDRELFGRVIFSGGGTLQMVGTRGCPGPDTG